MPIQDPHLINFRKKNLEIDSLFLDIFDNLNYFSNQLVFKLIKKVLLY